jgi:hypothetical protein
MPTRTADADINAPEARGNSAGNLNIILAVLETGEDHTHEDLQAILW